MTYRQLTLKERYRIATLRHWGRALRRASALGRARSTITRERGRNRTARRLNRRPRKRLNYDAPEERYAT